MTFNNTSTIVSLATGMLLTLSSVCAQGADDARPKSIKKLPYTTAELLDLEGRYTYEGEKLRLVRFPLGGIGSGSICLDGRGALVDWQIQNRPNVDYQPDHTFLGLWAKAEGEKPVFRVLEGPVPPHYAGNTYLGFPSGYGFGAMTPRGEGLPHFRKAVFHGQFPFGVVQLTDPRMPLQARIEGFSPFIPGNDLESSLPVAILNITLRNNTGKRVQGALGLNIGNICGAGAATHVIRTPDYQGLAMTRPDPSSASMVVATTKPIATWQGKWAGSDLLPSGGLQHYTETFCRTGQYDHRPAPQPAAQRPRPDLIIDDFESGAYDRWKVEGTAFSRPTLPAKLERPEPVRGHQGQHIADSATGDPSNHEWDLPKGRLTSEPFTIRRHAIQFRIGGGSHPGETCVNLSVDGKVVHTATGKNSEGMSVIYWDVSRFAGKKAQLQIVDDHSGAWGHILVDDILQTDKRPNTTSWPGGVGSFAVEVDLPPGAQETIPLVIAWYFRDRPEGVKNYYTTKWADADAVAQHTVQNLKRLTQQTRLFQKTFFSSTLPGIVEEAISSQLGVLRSPSVFRMEDGSLYGFEGCGQTSGCCPGTCMHVWHYVQSLAYLFPAIERRTREVDYRYRLRELDGHMANRLYPPYKYQPDNPAGGCRAAADGQFGTVLRVYREWQISGDTEWLKKLWPGVKKSIEYVWVAWDRDRDGLMERPRHCTLDLDLYGHETFCGSMYLVGLLAGEKMALAAGDTEAAREYRRVFELGRKNTDAELFNGEYYIQTLPEHMPTRAQYLTGCCEEQLIGQWWASMMGLGTLYHPENVRKATASIFEYNFLEDCYDHLNAGYAFNVYDDAGILICTWPRGGRPPQGLFYADIFHHGMEDQAIGNLIYQGYVLEGLAGIKAIRDRFDGRKRSPYDQNACGSYYVRGLANYSWLLALSGFHYSGVDQTIQIDPQVNRDDFRTFFSVEGGWGTISQKQADGKLTASVDLAQGKLSLTKLIVRPNGPIDQVSASLGQSTVGASTKTVNGLVEVTLEQPVEVSPNKTLSIELTVQ